MSWRNVGILALIVAVLGGFVYWSNNRESTPEEIPVPTAQPAELEPEALFPPTLVADVERLEIRYSGGLTETIFLRNESNDWVQTIPEPQELITPTVNTQITTLLGTSSRRTLAADANPIGAYGLDEPTAEIVLAINEEIGRARRVLLIGKEVTGGTAYYVQIEGDGRVFIVNKTSIDPILLLTESPPLAPTPTAEDGTTMEDAATPTP